MKTVKLPFNVKKPILACGADMKGVFALAKGKDAYLFDGFGDLSDLDNFTRYEKAVKAAEKKLKIKPRIVACDLHPEYFSTRFAKDYAQAQAAPCALYEVQHHEAHIASAVVDSGLSGEVLGAAFDGTGYGTDGRIWGGEFFTVKNGYFSRVAHLGYVPMPGGEMCIKEPWRMAASYILNMKNRDRHLFSKIMSCPRKRASIHGSRLDSRLRGNDSRKIGVCPHFSTLKDMIEKNINSPMTSSMGRLFDAVGSLVLNKERARFEAELPIELEKIADKNEDGHYDFELIKNRDRHHFSKIMSCPRKRASIHGSRLDSRLRGNDSRKIVSVPYFLDASKVIKGILKDLNKCLPASVISAKFHNTAAFMILKTAKRFNIRDVVLSGGVFQNKLLSEKTRKLLEQGGFRVHTHSNIETNDSGIPIGQIAIANGRS